MSSSVGVGCSLKQALEDLDVGLREVFEAVADCVLDISESMRTVSSGETGTQNEFGDKQLVADLMAEGIIRNRMKGCQYVGVISSEEDPVETVLFPPQSTQLTQEHEKCVYSVAFDPLDGSSIIGSNFAVGSIFGIWNGRGFLGKSGKEMAGAAYAVYGPRTVLVCAFPVQNGGNNGRVVHEFTLFQSKDGHSQWILSKADMRLSEEKKLFAPANLRASKENEEYSNLMMYWMNSQYTLRYTGGMVPDIHNIVTKGGGVFCNPISTSAPEKLRLLYECHPFTYIITAMGGASLDGMGDAAHHVISHHDSRSSICLGSTMEVERCRKAMIMK